jgi:ABC-type long-subunit fatty acid transport system fused permease/ATPase subunit
MERRFTALRIIGTVLKILAWIALLFGILLAVASVVVGFGLSGQEALLGLDLAGPLGAVAMFIAVIIVAIFNFLLLYAAGEAIYVFLAIEENTRRAAYILQQQYVSYQPGYPSPAPPQAYDEE